jgi:ankyrin repeat protein
MVTLLLLEFRASVVAKNGSHQTSALHMAARRRNISILQILLRNGANIMATDAQGNTPLHDAAIGNAPTAIQELCKHGADINAKNIKGETPLHLLMKCCFNLKTLLALFENGANPTIVDNKNRTILDIALRNCTEDPRENSIIALITSKQAEYRRWSLLRRVWAGAVVPGAGAGDTESGDTE